MKFGMGALLTAMLLLRMALVPTVGAKQNQEQGDVGILSVPVNGGYLIVDESQSTVTRAVAFDTSPDIAPGTPIQIAIQYTYIDTSAIYGGSINFKLVDPAGGVATKDITDNLLINDNANGYLYRTFTANPGQTYYFTISASRTGQPTASDTGIITPY
ncbi:hypothetical protein [Candidatus Methanoperedens nitratireducens]|uniref:Uncharacterized protein n=1 Tax=Candidatus Methanoperedens nitratireducens TaxID=1392998 RepID=A0A284VK43_9EURY|nr:hypothetical protein [Candidatus Methanoperedens nitroreducens]SNQ59635.1 exported hypothetical protein [Candidatus Methanoperedens nitroreducens]